MKKVILFFCFFAFISKISFSQSYEPTTKWPYLYDNFQNGTVFFSNGAKLGARVNVHLLKSALHYLKDELIYEMDKKDIQTVEIGNDQFVYCNNELAKVVYQLGDKYLVSLSKGDFDALTNESGAYGINSQTASTRKQSTLELGGLANVNYNQLKIEKDDGKSFPLKVTHYFIVNKNAFPATKKEVEKYIGVDKVSGLNDFVKNNKIKWKNAESLSLLLNFF